MKKSSKLSFMLVIILTMALVLAGCAKTPAETGDGDTFIIARSTDADLIDPGYAYDEGDIDIVFHIFDGLVQFKNDKLEVEPALATDWSVSDDGKVWTFNLREGVKFHDGTDFKSDAVVLSFKRVIDENNKYYGKVEGGWSYLNYLMGDIIEDVVAVDDYTVDIKLKQKFAPFLTYLGYYSEFIVSPAALEKYGTEIAKNPVGTGPFKYSNWKKGEYVELVANDDYWGEMPKIGKLIFKVVPEPSTRLMELQTGQVDAIKSIDPSQQQIIKDDENMDLISIPGANIFYGTINTTIEPYSNEKVRQALNYAIDMDKLVDVIYEGVGTRAINALPPTVFSFDDTAGPYEYNPEKAKQLLAEAGYPNGFDLELYTFVYARPYVNKPVQVAEVMKADLEKVGLNVTIISNEWATHSDIMQNMKHQVALTGWYDVPYPSNFLKTMALEGGYTGYQPQELMDLSLQALGTYDIAEQETLYKEFQQKLHIAAPIIPIAHNNYTAAVRSNVKGFELDIIGTVRAHKAYKE
ncbi:MAG: ABC transporter substrate-binding protein [Eubacteriales bacterium]